MYKVPEGTWLLGAVSLAIFAAGVRRGDRVRTADRAIVALFALAMFLVMSLGTNINIGLRYVLPIFPFAFVFMGQSVEAAQSENKKTRRAAIALICGCLGLNLASVASIHPHYLAYFNWASGGPGRGSERLIDSNLDWGQDLVGLSRWRREKAPTEALGLAYFGQIQPNLLKLGDPGFDWFVPPALPGKLAPSSSKLPRQTPRTTLEPGLYAASAFARPRLALEPLRSLAPGDLPCVARRRKRIYVFSKAQTDCDRRVFDFHLSSDLRGRGAAQAVVRQACGRRPIHKGADAMIRLSPLFGSISAEQAVYGSFASEKVGYAMSSQSRGCSESWLTDWRSALSRDRRSARRRRLRSGPVRGSAQTRPVDDHGHLPARRR